MATILLLSGPNLNLFGQRDPSVYGTDTLDDMVGDARVAAAEHGYELDHLQSNHEGALVDAIQDARGRCDAIIINPGALGHYSYALADALLTFEGVALSVPAIYFYAVFRNRVSSIAVESLIQADSFVRRIAAAAQKPKAAMAAAR